MIGVLFLNTLEFLAFLSGIYYFKRVGGKFAFYLVCFLGFTVLVEFTGHYTTLMDRVGWFESLKQTRWENNYWLYNIYLIVSGLFYATYFKWHLKSRASVKFLNVLLLSFAIGAVLYLFFSDVLFYTFSPFTLIFGTVMVLLSIALYHLELLKSDEVLKFNSTLPFYISIGAAIFHLCATPLLIYGYFFDVNENPEFAILYMWVIFSTNFVMYGLYILGFIICSRNLKR